MDTCTCTTTISDDSVTFQICDVCTPPPIMPEELDPEILYYQRIAAAYGENHPNTIRVGSFLGLLSACLFLLIPATSVVA